MVLNSASLPHGPPVPPMEISDIISTPPAIMQSACPAMTRAAAEFAASRPDEQKRLTTEPGMRSSKPARSSEERAMSAP